MRKFYVYVHTCPNGKKYVGATTQAKPEFRWQEGRGYGGIFLQDILKYGWDNITHEVFEVDSREEMYRKEIELISFYHSNDPRYGYNNSVGGEKSALGCRHSEESRKKQSEDRKGKFLSAEHKRHISKALKGKPLNEEHKKRIAEHNRRKAKNPEFRKKLSEACKNRPRIKISLPDGTIVEITKQHLVKDYVNKGKAFEYVP